MNAIRSIRLKAGLTQADLADKADVTPAAMANAERTDPRVDTVLKYASAAGVVKEVCLIPNLDWPDCVNVKLKDARKRKGSK